jgi:hypothetical protein
MKVYEGSRLLHETKLQGKPGLNQAVWNYTERVRELTAEEKEEMKKQAERMRGAGARGGRTGGMGGGRFGRGQGGPDPNYLNTQTGPGEYTVTVIVNGKEQSADFMVMKDSWVH